MSKVERAQVHLDQLQSEILALSREPAYAFRCEIQPDGIEHRYVPDAVAEIPPHWPLIVGDCIHNLRVALDHLTWELARAYGGSVPPKTSFPTERKGSGIRLAGIHPDAVRLIEQVQPYNTGDGPEYVGAIAAFDNIDKHRHVLLTTTAVQTTNYGFSPSRAPLPAPEHQEIFVRMNGLIAGQAAVRIQYVRPYFEVNPWFDFSAHIAFGERRHPFVEEKVPFTLSKMIRWMGEEFLPQFQRFFPQV